MVFLRRGLSCLYFFLFLCSGAWAQDEPKALEETDATREGEVEMQDGESRRKPVIDTLTYETQAGLPVAASKIYFTDQKFSISGFGEINYTNFLGPKDNRSGDIELYNTNLYRFVSYMAYKPKPWLVLYGEIFAEFFQDWGKDNDHEIFFEVFADFLLHKKFNLRAGWLQPQIGYVNNNDEPILFFSVNRPEVERIIIPSQWIDLGVMTYGSITEDLSYTLSLFQGLDANNFRGGTWIRGGREHSWRFNFDSFILNSQWTYNAIKNTTLSASRIYTKAGNGQPVTVNGEVLPVSANTTLVSAYARTTLKRWSIMMLGAYGRMDQTDRIHSLTDEILGSEVYGAYLEIGFDLMPSFVTSNDGPRSHTLYKAKEAKLPVFARYERLNTHSDIHHQFANSEHAIYATDLHALTVGINFNPRRNIVLKSNYQFRYNKQRLTTGEREGDRFEVGAGFIF